MLPFPKPELEGSWSDWHENVILGGQERRISAPLWDVLLKLSDNG